VFSRDNNGDIYHTYSSYERGIDLMTTTYNFLDLTAKGRDENPDRPQDWVRYHERIQTRVKRLLCLNSAADHLADQLPHKIENQERDDDRASERRKNNDQPEDWNT